MSAGHTPAPWSVDVWDYPSATPPRRDLIVQTSQFWIAKVAWDEGMDNPYTIAEEEARANARLIAAAPELLAVLKMTSLDLHAADEQGQCLCSQCEFRRAAAMVIAKAEGREG